MAIRVAFFALFVLAACSDPRSSTPPLAAAKTLALPTASLEPDPTLISFKADPMDWHTFTVRTTADSVLVVVNPVGSDPVLAVASGTAPPAQNQCPAQPDNDPARSQQSGESVHLVACSQGTTQILVKEHCYDLVLARYTIRVGADEADGEGDEESDDGGDRSSFFDLFGTEIEVRETGGGGDADTSQEEEADEPDEAPDEESADEGSVASDRAVLSTFYVEMSGILWDSSRNWQSGAPLSQWHGVTTDADGRVTKIELADNLVLGYLPAALGDLEKLEVLDLSDNLLIGVIPPELGNLTNLKVLDFNSNLLEGPIPPELGNLTNLEVLNLEWNLLEGRFPRELGNLKNLQVLRVAGFIFEGMSGCIPASLRAVPDNDLRWLNLPNCSGSAKIVAGGQRRPGETEAREALLIKQAQVRELMPLLQ